jgi:hypothetical protein
VSRDREVEGLKLRVDAFFLDGALSLEEARKIFGKPIIVNDHKVVPLQAGQPGYFIATWQTVESDNAGTLKAPGFSLMVGGFTIETVPGKAILIQ